MSDLGELGLSSYEESAYRALLTLGPAAASDVAGVSDVPRGRIYDVLNGLASRDLVRVHAASDPRRYEAVDPDRAVDRLLAERERELDAERERLEELAASVSDDLSGTLPVQGQFWEIDLGDDDAVAGMREQFDRVDERIRSVIGPPYAGAPVDAYRAESEAFADLLDGRVALELLTTPAILEAQPPELLDTFATEAVSVRTTPAINLSYDVIDGEVVYVSVPAPFADHERVGAVVVRDADLAAAMDARFEDAWAAATPVEAPTADD